MRKSGFTEGQVNAVLKNAERVGPECVASGWVWFGRGSLPGLLSARVARHRSRN